jgi:hypothetical protein
MSERRVIGFDRELRLEWLDAVASRAAAGDTPETVRPWLNDHLADALGGKGRSGNRGKTVTVLTRIWVNVPSRSVPLRNRALCLLTAGDASERLALHWAMASAVYPFFADVVSVMGRLLLLQGEVERQAVMRRVIVTWGDRPAVSRGCRAVWTSVIGWGVLAGGTKRGRYTWAEPPLLVSANIKGLLRAALAPNAPGMQASTQDNIQVPGLFPFSRDTPRHTGSSRPLATTP